MVGIRKKVKVLFLQLNAIQLDGCEVLGYLGWGLIDLPSSTGDMEKRYGMIYVNRGNHDLRDMRRVPKKSFYWFKDYLAELKQEKQEG